MKTHLIATTGYMLPRAATFAVLVAIMGCDSDRETNSIAAPPSDAAEAEYAAEDTRPNYTDRVTSDDVERDDMGQSADSGSRNMGQSGADMGSRGMDQCSDRVSRESADNSQDWQPKSARAEVRPTVHGEAEGTVTFAAAEGDRAIRATVDLRGLEPGPHGFHIHEVGDCSADDASSAGGHFNPQDAPHGSRDGTERHAGDMGNIEADSDGRVNTELTLPGLAFSGSTSILQKAVVIHRQKDDLDSQPAGDSGDRVGCGVIRSESNSSAQ